jgi:hypothetical protein
MPDPPYLNDSWVTVTAEAFRQKVSGGSDAPNLRKKTR